MFEPRNGSLRAEAVPPETIAGKFGTPCFVYSRAALSAALARFQAACNGRDVLVCCTMAMSSNYNSRLRAAEVTVDGIRTHLIREREQPEALFALEHLSR